MAENKAGFGTALFGFQKADVLACIDRMSAQALEQQEEAARQMQALNESLDALRSEKEALLQEGEEKTEEIARLNAEIEAHKAQIEQQNEKAAALAEALRVAEVSARDYKNRLFTREEEAVLLRGENAQLTQALSSKQREVEQADMQAHLAQQSARDEIAQVQSRAEQEKEQVRVQMQGSATAMVEDLAALKNDLAILDRRLVDSMAEMQRSTQTLAKALEMTEQNVERLGAKLVDFPQVQETPAPHEYDVARATREAARKTAAYAKGTQQNYYGSPLSHEGAVHGRTASAKMPKQPQPLAELLLTKLSKILGE